MDFKTFSKFIILVGILTCIGGGIFYLNNQPVGYEQVAMSRSNPFAAFGRNAQAKWAARDENMRRNIRREKATDWMTAGGIVLVVGVGVFFSAEKKIG